MSEIKKVWEPTLEESIEMIKKVYDLTDESTLEDSWSKGYYQCMGDLLLILQGYSCYIFEEEEDPPVT